MRIQCDDDVKPQKACIININQPKLIRQNVQQFMAMRTSNQVSASRASVPTIEWLRRELVDISICVLNCNNQF